MPTTIRRANTLILAVSLAGVLCVACGDDGDDADNGSTQVNSNGTTGGTSNGLPSNGGPPNNGLPNNGLPSNGTSASNGTSNGTGTTGGTNNGTGDDMRERLILATGEYDCTKSWDGLMRLEDVSDPEEGQEADFLIDVPGLQDSDGLALDFIHGLYMHEGRDELYVSALFTSIDEDVQICNFDVVPPTDFFAPGSIAILSDFTEEGGNPGSLTVARHITGDQTMLHQPHNVWVDEERELIYAANAWNSNILVWEDAYTVNGNVAPSRVITSPNLRFPAFVYIDTDNDRMFVANFASLIYNPNDPHTDSSVPSILIFNNASQLDGEVTPDIRIVDDRVAPDNTRLTLGQLHITHDVKYDPGTGLMFVVHHTNEVLMFNLTDVEEACDDLLNCELAPQAVIQVNTNPSDLDYWSSYDVLYLPEVDRLYVSVGLSLLSNIPELGAPYEPGLMANSIKVYDGVSQYEGGPTIFPTSREITWSSSDDHYPPQPFWITRH